VKLNHDVTIKFGSPLTVILEVEQRRASRSIVTIRHADLTVRGENMAEVIGVGHIGTIDVTWQDADGNAVSVDGPTTWASTDTSIITVEVSTGNDHIANWHTVGIGLASIYASGDADLGEGVKKITATTDFQVIPGEAVAGEMNVEDLGPGSPSPGGPVASPAGAKTPPKR
jgi:hypothetical protein